MNPWMNLSRAPAARPPAPAPSRSNYSMSRPPMSRPPFPKQSKYDGDMVAEQAQQEVEDSIGQTRDMIKAGQIGIADRAWERTYTAVALPMGTVIAWTFGDMYKRAKSIEEILEVKVIVDKRVDIYRKKWNKETGKYNTYADKDSYFGGWDDIRETSIRMSKQAMGRVYQERAAPGQSSLFWGVRPMAPDSYYSISDIGFQLWLWQFVQLNVMPFERAKEAFIAAYDDYMGKSKDLSGTVKTRKEHIEAYIGQEAPTGAQLIEALENGSTDPVVLLCLVMSLKFYGRTNPSKLYEIGKVEEKNIKDMKGGLAAKEVRMGMLTDYMVPDSQMLDFKDSQELPADRDERARLAAVLRSRPDRIAHRSNRAVQQAIAQQAQQEMAQQNYAYQQGPPPGVPQAVVPQAVPAYPPGAVVPQGYPQ